MSQTVSDRDIRLAETTLSWSGWGSPVGLGLFLLALAGCVAILRFAWILH